jgi:hypothetical protein
MIRVVRTILAAVERLPAFKLEIDDAQRSAGVRVGVRLVARIDLRHGVVLGTVPADTIPILQRVFPSSRPLRTGSPSTCPTLKAVPRSRSDSQASERAEMIWQFRVGPP